MVVFPNAKINLGLHITEQRPDGYHNIESIFTPIPITDALEITVNKCEKTIFKNDGIDIPPNGKTNLVEQAWILFNEKFKIPTVDLDLLKKIPIGAGLGGGSSDAAACMKSLNQIFKLGISERNLISMASQLGADCAFFIKNKTTYAKGIGDIFSDIEIDLSKYHFIVVYPNIHVSTVDAYKHVKPKKPNKDIREIIKRPIENWKNELKNDFEDSVFIQYPKISEIKNELYNQGAIYASMSGSGSTVFGIFKENPKVDFNYLGKFWSFKL